MLKLNYEGFWVILQNSGRKFVAKGVGVIVSGSPTSLNETKINTYINTLKRSESTLNVCVCRASKKNNSW